VGPLPVEDVGPIEVEVNVNSSGRDTGRLEPGTRQPGTDDGGGFIDGLLREINPTEEGPLQDRIMQDVEDLNEFLGVAPDDGDSQTSDRSAAEAPSVEVTHKPTYDATVDSSGFDQLADDVVDEVKSSVGGDIEELKSKIQSETDRVSDLENKIRRGLD